MDKKQLFESISVAALVMVLPAMLANSVMADCYTPTQYSVIDQMALNMNMSNTSLRMVFEQLCTLSDNVYKKSEVDMKVNLTLFNVNQSWSNITDIINSSAHKAAQNEVLNYTSWWQAGVDKLVDYRNLTRDAISIANSSSQYSAFSTALDSAKKANSDALEKAKDEITSSLAGYARLNDLSNMTYQLAMMQGQLNNFNNKITENWNTTLMLLGIILVVALIIPVAWKNNWLGGNKKDLAALKGMLAAKGHQGLGRQHHVNELTLPQGPDGIESKSATLRKGVRDLHKEIDEDRIREARLAVEAAMRKNKKRNSRLNEDDDEENEDED